MTFFFFLFFQAFLSSQKDGVDSRDFLHTTYHYTCMSSFIIYISHQRSTFVVIAKPTLKHYLPNPNFIQGFIPGVVHFISLYKCIMTHAPLQNRID